MSMTARLATVNYGGLLQEILKGSKAEAVVMLKRKEDLFEQEKDAVAAMLQGTHTFVDAKAYGQFQLYIKYKVRVWISF
ncbi:hypothetical protein Pmani_006222 [Petrolisthes manimaculis]|uniref:Uncharacterized protein n=1 Tax=Petrolisthes manimaculis TaxID=1843537 RepID=A0AAE1QC60_9EUCA|nr:hypothetical protein Pmani_006222 [Petrolisthes manimaculis]